MAEPIPLAKYLADAGLTESEIAAELGIDRAQVARLPELASVGLGASHVARVERSLYDAAVGGTTWQEAIASGEVVRLERDRRPDAAAAKTILQAHAPDRYGDTPALTINVPASELSTAQLRAIVARHTAGRGAVIDAMPVHDAGAVSVRPSDEATDP